MTWVLILFMYSPNGDSVTSVPNFYHLESCNIAGQLAVKQLAGQGRHKVSFVCVNRAGKYPK